MTIYIPDEIWNIIKLYLIDWKYAHKKKYIYVLNTFKNNTKGILINYPLFVDNNPDVFDQNEKNLLKYTIKKYNPIINKFFYSINYSYVTKNDWYNMCMDLNRYNTGF